MGGPRKWFKTLVGLKKHSKASHPEEEEFKQGHNGKEKIQKDKKNELNKQGDDTELSTPSGNISDITQHLKGSCSYVHIGQSREEAAAIRIQTAFRGLLARKALRALRGLVRLQALARGQAVRKQAAMTLRCMQALVRVQARVRARRACAIEDLNMQQSFDNYSHEHNYEAGWCDKIGSIDELRERERKRQEAAAKRERARSYAYNHQWQPNTKAIPEQNMKTEPDRTNIGWNWLERWMATHPWENKNLLDHAKMDGTESISSNTVDQSLDGTPIHYARKPITSHARNQSVGNLKEGVITGDTQTKKRAQGASPVKTRANQKSHPVQQRAHQGAEGRKSPLKRSDSRTIKSKQTKQVA